MSYQTYAGSKGRGRDRTFVKLRHDVIDSENFQSLNLVALRLLLCLARQYNGKNNGDLCAAETVLKKWGWSGSDSITRAKKELLNKGWIVLSRQGGLGIGCSLYALTWFPIDDCKGKIDLLPTRKASDDWKKHELKNLPHLN